MHEHDEDDNVFNFQSLSSQFDRSLSSPTEAMSLPSNIEVCYVHCLLRETEVEIEGWDCIIVD